ncbi:MAG: tRNA 2-thiouridine(34) synthase MnmA [Ignavibacteriales bacterium]|nr:tRNA 2-thiouridine(34) synthase MnmA [Ignavibacteriales bacterium]
MKIAVLLSGGVDSSVALRLLQEQGHDITAFYLKIWLQDEFSFLGDCPWEEDLEFARAVCSQANVPLEVLPLQDEYWSKVVSYTIREIKAGRTPNPDMFCNSLIKFGAFVDKVDSSYEKIASGHYAVSEIINGDVFLKRSPDPVKDQTYFLAYLTKEQLARTCFPIGIYNKPEVRQLAEEFNLPNMSRKDSQGICFLGKISFRNFIKYHLGEVKGDIVDIHNNKKMGEHAGYYYYTIGQRQGLGLSGGPWYVVRKDVVNNIIYISNSTEMIDQTISEFFVGNINWINRQPEPGEPLTVKIRHGVGFFNCSFEAAGYNSGLVRFAGSDKGIAEGQFAVFYAGEYCLGGGIIGQQDTF